MDVWDMSDNLDYSGLHQDRSPGIQERGSEMGIFDLQEGPLAPLSQEPLEFFGAYKISIVVHTITTDNYHLRK
jgi:hypothetical protein